MSSAAYWPDGQLIPPDTVPGYSGASDECYYNFMSGERYRLVEYYDGGVNISVAPAEATYSVRIGYEEMVRPGATVDVPVTLEEFDHTQGLAGFNLVVAYDNTALTIQSIGEGDLYDSCGWEYFTYRLGPFPNCGGSCPSGLLRLVGIAETNNGPYHPNPECAVDNPGWVPTVPVTMAKMSFRVSADANLECQFVPIRFFWIECSDNMFVNHDGSKTYLSSGVFEVGIPTSIAGVEAFPTYRGAQAECLEVNPLVTQRAVDFYNGGLQIICTDTIDYLGDINCNAIAFEIADAVMFSSYFVEGFTAFGNHVECSIAASDVNSDGKPLTIEDFVWLERVISGEAVPPAPTDPSPNPATFVWNPETGEVDVSTVDQLGGIYMIVEGEMTPELLADQMDMKFGWDTGWTKILITGDSVTAEPLVSIAGASGIVSVVAATYDARPVVTSVEISDGTTMTVAVEVKNDVSWDTEVDLNITLDGLVPPMGGFDFLLGYPETLIQLVSATPGTALFEDCEWEYFTYQNVVGCGTGCPEKLVRIVGVAETYNGPYHPSCYEPAGLPATIATLHFLTGDRSSTQCLSAPLRFFWQDCSNNMITEVDGQVTYVSRVVLEAGSILPREASFPTYGGTPDGCMTPMPGSYSTVLRRINYLNGWIDFVCTDTNDLRGDINLNEVHYEAGDAEMFSEYFVQGLSAFDPHVEGSVAASDANADGLPLTVPDLVFLIRVMTGEAGPDDMPPSVPSPSRTHIHWQPENGLTWVDMPDSLGAMYLVVAGEITPTLLAGNMQMKYGWDGGLTKILIFSFDPGSAIRTGLLVSIPGALDVVYAETASYMGRAINLVIMNGTTDVDDDPLGTLPGDFALHPNRPNPFNPSTAIRYDLPEQARVEITVYNMIGQVVRTLVDRHVSPGQHEVIWDGCDDTGHPVSSGLYLYRMTAGDFTQSRKMLLLK